MDYRPFVYCRSTRLVILTLLAVSLRVIEIFPAGREKVERWLEIRSPHFIVASNAAEKDARRVADRFERIRAVFHEAFPRMRVDPAAPIIVLAAKNEKSFRTIEPESWRQKGQLQRSGMFLRGPEKNYVILRLDSSSEQPYHVLFHEYTHLLIHQNVETLPLWLDEGLAEFYGNSDIHEKEVWLGEPSSSHVSLLRENKLLPLETLFRVDYSSPYYNEQNKGSMFYAESWALVHYLMLKGSQGGNRPLASYLAAVAQGADPTVAAHRAFGDLAALEKQLEAYVRQSTFSYARMKGSTEIDDEAFAVRDLAPAEAAALHGDFLAHTQSYSEARAFLEESLREDPSQTLACEGMGFLEFQQGNQDEARKWFARAIKLNSQSYLADYYYGVMTMQEQTKAGGRPPEDVESSLRSAIRTNPNFAPAYDALAAYYLIRGENLEQAHMSSLRATTLDPGNIRYLLNGANVLLRMQRADDAVRVGERALAMAKSVEERAAVETFLSSARQFQQYLDSRTQAAAETAQSAQDSQPQRLELQQADTHDLAHSRAPSHAPLEPPGSPLQDTVEGKIVEISCKPPALRLTLQRPSYKLELHARDVHQVDFRSANSAPVGPMDACSSLRNRRARVVYRLGSENAGEIVSVQVLE